MKTRAYKAGFTLIELSIVLLIIGLISAGIVTGRTLIKAAEVHAQVSQLAKYDTAVNAFRSKYNCLPGDCADAVSLGLCSGAAMCANGDGNGKIGDHSLFGATENFELFGRESSLFWYELGQAGLVEPPVSSSSTLPGMYSPPLKMVGYGRYPGTGQPVSSPGGVTVMGAFTVQDLFRGVSNDMWLLSATVLNQRGLGVYVAEDAYALDAKLDDGAPLTGIMRVSTNWSTRLAPGPHGYGYAQASYPVFIVDTTTTLSDNTACVNDASTPAIYNFASREPTLASLCTPIIRTQY